MSTMFTEYPDISEKNSNAEDQDLKKTSKLKKKMKKHLKKQKKILDRFAELREQQKQYAGDFSSSDNGSFANKLGDAFVKAAPSIFTTIVTKFICSYFTSKKH